MNNFVIFHPYCRAFCKNVFIIVEQIHNSIIDQKNYFDKQSGKELLLFYRQGILLLNQQQLQKRQETLTFCTGLSLQFIQKPAIYVEGNLSGIKARWKSPFFSISKERNIGV